MSLTVAAADQLRELLAQKGWLDRVHHPDDGPLIERVLQNASLLDDNQRRVYSGLIESYLYMPDYRPSLYEILYKVRSFVKPFSTRYLAPLKKKRERKQKSGDSVSYSFGTLLSQKDGFTRLDSPFSDLIENHPESAIVLLDDFVGTGETFDEVFEEFRVKYPDVNVMLAVVAGQEWGIERIRSKGVAVVAEHIRKKALTSGDYVSGNVADNLVIYDSIELMLDISHEFRRGYGASEATVTIENTPDNTLPIFWNEINREDMVWPALFQRR